MGGGMWNGVCLSHLGCGGIRSLGSDSAPVSVPGSGRPNVLVAGDSPIAQTGVVRSLRQTDPAGYIHAPQSLAVGVLRGLPHRLHGGPYRDNLWCMMAFGGQSASPVSCS